ncbi:hypothetical protein GCD22_01629 [Acidithiobacillus thiooxidans ATCC 19377]|uniref:Uncharacterized protein n=1 Tax=Acidithiobacillus thiooxidans ATCC 19377 TaxID=637390 RepID=A0A5P9XQR1_ACITH|nr:hypothetical protein GCD22_01629 [Acidithiobacillus thiooxidans ATCC 19377]
MTKKHPEGMRHKPRFWYPRDLNIPDYTHGEQAIYQERDDNIKVDSETERRQRRKRRYPG